MARRVSGITHTQKQLDNYANQRNPNSTEHSANLDNHSNQLNPNNPEYNKETDDDDAEE